MGMKYLSRRNRIILYIMTVLIVLSMILSAIVAFTPTAQQVRDTPTPVATQAR